MNQVTVVTDTRTDLELAREFASAKMVPAHYQKSPGDCYIAIKLAQRFRMDVWSVMQEMFLINGRPMMSGKLATAILNNSLAEPLRPTYSGEGDDRTITLSGRPEGDATPLTVQLKVKDCRTQNEQWRRSPDQMLMYAAARMWGRRFAPDILLGIVFDDEEVTTPAAPTRSSPAALAPAEGLKPQATTPPHDAETGEIAEPHELEVRYNENTNEPETFVEWGARFLNHVKTSVTVAEIAAWNALNADTLVEIKEAAPKVYARLEAAINAHRIKIAAATDGEAT
jgi:hypothetical protein